MILSRKERRAMERERHTAIKAARDAGQSEGYRRAREEYERRRVLHIAAPTDKRTVLIGEEPEIEVCRVALQREAARLFNPVDVSPWMPPVDVVNFRARRQSWQAGTGQVVTWWTWEPMQ